MVEFTIGHRIKNNNDKLIIAPNMTSIKPFLNSQELLICQNISQQISDGKIHEFCLGNYKLFLKIVKRNTTALEWQQIGAEAYGFIKNIREIKVCFTSFEERALNDFSLGLEMASYRFDKYFTKKPESFYPKLEKVLYTNTGLKNMLIYKPVAGLARSIRYARDLINEPANEMTPEIMAADINRLSYLGLQIEILDEAQMKEHNFNLAFSVAQGSVNRPKIAILKWKGNAQKKDFEIGLVGKGVTFDSGGISIKPALNMGDMKQDMAGAAAVVATMKSLALQKTEKNVVAVVGLVENMPSGSASRPGDVIKSMSGQTVEITNTDAEGRLVLADCLTYIQRQYKPKYVIDMATLTGAIVIALGNAFAGLFCNNQTFAKRLITAGKTSGERLWQMPMDSSYNKLMDSSIADMKNTGGRAAGSATAACFLQRYIEKDTKWAHIDIAGMDMSEGKNLLYPKGASGFGVKLLNDLISNF